MARSMGVLEGVLLGATKDLGSVVGRDKVKTFKSLDWVKAAYLIRAHKPVSVEAGLHGDFNETRGVIFKDGQVATMDEDYFGTSCWAIPVLVMHLKDGEILELECWAEGNQDPHMWWPENALKMLTGG